MIHPDTQRGLELFIRQALEARISTDLEAIVERACADLRRRVSEQKGAIVMSVLKNFDVARATDRIVITVHDRLTEERANG